MKEEKEIEEIRQKLSVFSFPRLQELLTLHKLLEREKISLEDVKEFIASVLNLEKSRKVAYAKFRKDTEERWNKNTKKCPDCGKPLLLRSLNIPKGKENVYGYTCHWYCSGEECLFEEYTKGNFQRTYRKIMEGR